MSGIEIEHRIDPDGGKGGFMFEQCMWARIHFEAQIRVCLYLPFSVCPVGHTPSL